MPDDAHDAVVSAMVAIGASAVQDAGATLTTYLPASIDRAGVVQAVRRCAPDALVTIADAPEADRAAWPTRVGVQHVGRIAVTPPWLVDTVPVDAVPVIIEPAMAFGTGEHETTRSALWLLQRTLVPGDRVADLGAGSGVLGIAAAKLGASRVAAVEMDPDAIDNAESDVVTNNVGDRVFVVHGDAIVLLPLVAPIDLALVNIVSSVIVQLLAPLRAALTPAGRAVLSGILDAERADLETALTAGGWCVTADDREGDWWSCVIVAQ